MGNRFKLKNMLIKGFKSFSPDSEAVELRDINVCIGPNAAGKSNLVSFFKMLNYMTTGSLQQFVGQEGFADSILHYGSAHTPIMQAKLDFENETEDKDTYSFSLAQASGGTLIFTEEILQWKRHEDEEPVKIDLGAGHAESKLKSDVEAGGKTSKVVYSMLKGCQAYQFHDTSSTALIRNPHRIDDNRFLYDDAGNLPAFLYAMANRDETRPYYERIVRHVRSVIPKFKNFILEPTLENENYIRLDWEEEGARYNFGPNQLSDGSLRFIAMLTLLLQPPHLRPNFIVLDEPELGLHPAALAMLGEIIKQTSEQTQVLLATQSSSFVDAFEAEDILVFDRDEKTGSSKVTRHNSKSLAEWLKHYSLSELWEKNVMGGRP
jgi:predicted ATPase